MALPSEAINYYYSRQAATELIFHRRAKQMSRNHARVLISE